MSLAELMSKWPTDAQVVVVIIAMIVGFVLVSTLLYGLGLLLLGRPSREISTLGRLYSELDSLELLLINDHIDADQYRDMHETILALISAEETRRRLGDDTHQVDTHE